MKARPMDRITVVIIVLAVLAVGSAAIYLLWGRRRRARRLTIELLNGYFQGSIDAPQFARRLREWVTMASQAAGNSMPW